MCHIGLGMRKSFPINALAKESTFRNSISVWKIHKFCRTRPPYDWGARAGINFKICLRWWWVLIRMKLIEHRTTSGCLCCSRILEIAYLSIESRPVCIYCPVFASFPALKCVDKASYTQQEYGQFDYALVKPCSLFGWYEHAALWRDENRYTHKYAIFTGAQ